MSEEEPTDPRSHAGHLDSAEVTFLAAQALPDREARALMSHVESCGECSERFATAVTEIDAVRGALRAHDAAAMPGPVWERIEAAMATEVARSQRAVRPVRPAPIHRTRREEREGAAGRRSRLPAFLAAAAVFVVLVAGVGTLTTRLMSTGSDSSAAGASPQSAQAARDAAEGSAPGAGRAVVLTSGTNYTKAQVSAQAQALVAQAQATSTLAARPAPSVPNARLAEPAALQECLAALYAQDVPPVAVDLASWEGREAAIIILPARDGGYEFWAVSRSCRKDNDGALYFTTLPAAGSPAGSATGSPTRAGTPAP